MFEIVIILLAVGVFEWSAYSFKKSMNSLHSEDFIQKPIEVGKTYRYSVFIDTFVENKKEK